MDNSKPETSAPDDEARALPDRVVDIISAARDRWCTDDLEIDDELTEKDVSEGEGGAWVRAWVWVPDSDLPDGDDEEEAP